MARWPVARGLPALRHPQIFPLLLQRAAVTPGARRTREVVYAALREAGLAEDDVVQMERLLVTAVLGFAASEAGGRFAAHSADPARRRLRPAAGHSGRGGARRHGAGVPAPSDVPACPMEHFHQVTEDLRAPYRELTEAIPGVISGYGAIHTAAMADGALSMRMKELMALAIAITRECDGCISAHARGAPPNGGPRSARWRR